MDGRLPRQQLVGGGWTRTHDHSPAFAANLAAVLADLGAGVDHGPDR